MTTIEERSRSGVIRRSSFAWISAARDSRTTVTFGSASNSNSRYCLISSSVQLEGQPTK
jgi:hypothetical protein